MFLFCNGEILAKCSESINYRIRYTGQQHDQVTGQHYLRARYYNPTIGRFTQEDTYRGDGLNLYAYCGNNSVRYHDPSGHDGTEYLEKPSSENRQSRVEQVDGKLGMEVWILRVVILFPIWEIKNILSIKKYILVDKIKRKFDEIP